MNGRASQGEQLAGISGLALILIMFLFAWYGIDAGNADINGFDAFDAYGDWLNLILVLTAFAGISLALYGTSAARVQLPSSLAVITTALGAISAILILIFLIAPPDVPTFGGAGIDVDLDRKIGVFLGLLAALGIAAGGYLTMQEQGTSFGAEADRLSERGASRSRRPRADTPPAEPPPSPDAPPRAEPPPPPPPPPPPSSGP